MWGALSDERTDILFALQSNFGPGRSGPMNILRLESGPVISWAQGSISVASYYSQELRRNPSLTAELTNSMSKVSYGRQSIERPVVVSGHHLGPSTNFSLSSMEIVLKYCGFLLCGVPLTRGWVCNVQLLLGLAITAFLGPGSRGTRNNNLLSPVSDTPNWSAKFLYLYP
jgi:hypothetical protein